ncbi:MAG: NAD(P)/FAD-dependent oxidoreductase [Proteobacteria bacterium]|nr:NAD(P)/FAD-dependent oxidoreductase [Pseudomonadota bacterium]
MKNPRIIVIGTGIGGSGAAALLAKAGADVMVFENSGRIGGKTGAIDKDGFNVEVGAHISPRSHKGPLGDLARAAGFPLEFYSRYPILTFFYDGKKKLIGPNLGSPMNLLRFALLFKPRGSYLGLLRFFLKMRSFKSEEDVKPLLGVPALTFIREYIKEPNLLSFMQFVAGMMFTLAPENSSAAYFLWCFARWFEAGASGYPVGGYGIIPRSCMDICEAHGGTVHLSEGVKRIVVENGKVTGVETSQGFYPADVVVSNAGIARTIELAGREHFPDTDGKNPDKLADSEGNIILQYGLDGYKPLETPTCIYMQKDASISRLIKKMRNNEDIEDAIGVFFASPTVADPSLAPPGKHVLLAVTFAPADMLDHERNQRYLDALEKKTFEVFPGMEKHILWKRAREVGYFAGQAGKRISGTVGMAQSWENDFVDRSPRQPVEGLYVAGTDTGGINIGTEAAAVSALVTARMVLEDHPVK